MTNFTEPAPVPSERPVPFIDRLRLATAAYLARFTGSSREHTESDLRCFLAWCAEGSRTLRRRPPRHRHRQDGGGQGGAHAGPPIRRPAEAILRATRVGLVL